MKQRGWIAAVAPGILIAATGVGAGDLLTGSLAGSAVGLVILWAAAVGAVVKWFLNEGIARWQMATGTTLLEGWATHLGRSIRWVFLGYLIVWTVFVGGALVSACGIAATALCPLSDDIGTSKIIWGIIHSFAGVLLVVVGGFRLFERLMGLSIAVMFVTVLTTAFLIRPDLGEVVRGLTFPTIPEGGLGWVLGLLGGVGGTVTLLSYGYWIREVERTGSQGLRACRIDLALGYALTAIFGMAMVIIGSRVTVSKGNPNWALDLADQLARALGESGELGRWVFLIGFWGTVASSLLGVWQSVPYLFADFLHLRRPGLEAERTAIDLTATTSYRVYLVAISVVSLPLLWMDLPTAQKAYAVLGSFFLPMLALTLLIMNNRADWVGRRYCNGWLTNIVLVATIMFFGYVVVRTAAKNLPLIFNG